jgi:murein DD-endopeptidase MepM/ murein hydrolase activator NlpD
MKRRIFLVSIGSAALVGCRGRSGDDETPSPTTSPADTPTSAPMATATPERSPTPTAPAATATPGPPQPEPFGFPVDPSARTGLVVGAVGSRTIRWGEGPTVLAYSRDDQPSDDPVRANAAGWNARTHAEYEGQPAVDWYLPTGTPVVATMDGLATLLINTVSNPFEVYGVSREAYIGNPDRSRAPISPFPGPGGGQGVFIRVENRQFRTDYAHLEIAPTLGLVPDFAWLSAYSAAFPYSEQFAQLRDFRLATAIAAWDVKKGDVIGYTGDSGYSEAPHLHYTVRRTGAFNLLSPTTEAGFEDGGWLFRP